MTQTATHQPAAPDLASPARSGVTTWLPPLLLVLAGLAAYANCFGGVFIFDDLRHVLVREDIRSLWPLPSPLDTHDRRPLVTISLALNYAFGEFNPAGYHAFNLAVHLLAGLALYGIVRRTIVRAAAPPLAAVAPWIALAVAAIWTVHPMQTGAVTYTIQRAESMMGLFYLLTLYAFIRGAESRRPAPWYVASAVACAAGMMCKAVMITAPAMVLLYDWVFIGPTAAAIVRRRWGVYLGLGAAVLLLVFNGLLPGILSTKPGSAATVGFRYKGVTPIEYARSQPGVILYYLRLSFWPQRLCLDYQWPVAGHVPGIIASSVVVGGAVLLTAWGVLRRHWLGYLGAWFFIILGPTSSIVPVRDLAFEHRMYLSLAAVVAAVVVLAALGLQRIAAGGGPRGRGAIVAAILILLPTAALAARTHLRNRDYHDAIAMWRDVVEFRPGNARAWNELGNALQSAGDHEAALEAYETVTTLDPTLWNAHAGRAACYVRMNRMPEALAAWEAVLPGTEEPAYVHYHLGNTNLALDRTAAAVSHYRTALEHDPEYVAALLDLARAYGIQRRFDLALPRLRTALELDPGSAVGHVYLGHVLRETGKLAEAAAAYRAALELDPANETARQALAYTEQLLGQ